MKASRFAQRWTSLQKRCSIAVRHTFIKIVILRDFAVSAAENISDHLLLRLYLDSKDLTHLLGKGGSSRRTETGFCSSVENSLSISRASSIAAATAVGTRHSLFKCYKLRVFLYAELLLSYAQTESKKEAKHTDYNKCNYDTHTSSLYQSEIRQEALIEHHERKRHKACGDERNRNTSEHFPDRSHIKLLAYVAHQDDGHRESKTC